MNIKPYLLLLVLSVCFFACQKELKDDVTPPGDNNNPSTDSTNAIVGTWKFISIEGTSQSSAETALGNVKQKTLLFLNYLTTENGGTIVIDDSTMNCKGITYKVYSTIKTLTYKNDVLQDSTGVPYTNIFPPKDSYSPYKMVSADSIVFRNSAFSNISASRFNLSPTGAKINLSGNILTFTEQLNKDSTQNIAGVNSYISQRGVAVIKMQRQ